MSQGSVTTYYTIEEFCAKHGACNDGKQWALDNCDSMQSAWDTLKPEWLIWVAIQPDVLTDKELRLFAVFCARSVQHLMTDARSVNAIDVAERHANGEATDEELAAAWDAARAAALDAARAAAWDAARDAAWDAVWDAARAAARAAAWDAARDAQVKWLRDNTRPNFNKHGVGSPAGSEELVSSKSRSHSPIC